MDAVESVIKFKGLKTSFSHALAEIRFPDGWQSVAYVSHNPCAETPYTNLERNNLAVVMSKAPELLEAIMAVDYDVSLASDLVRELLVRFQENKKLCENRTYKVVYGDSTEMEFQSDTEVGALHYLKEHHKVRTIPKEWRIVKVEA